VLIPRLTALVAAVPRVMREPGASVLLSAFAADGLELTVSFWIADPDNGQANVKSAVNLVVLRLLDESGIEIAYPKRVARPD